MKKSLQKLLLFKFLIACVLGCKNNSLVSTEIHQPLAVCPEKPSVVLTANNVKKISLNNQTIKESGQASSNKSIAYIFDATAGQEFKYKTTEDNICVWMYSPNNQILNNMIIPETGKYTVQIAALQGATSFSLEMSLQNSNITDKNVLVSSSRSLKPSSINSSYIPSRNQGIGWIWLGSVNNKVGTFSYGEALIPSNRQPVTITPSVVPSPKTIVILKSTTNLRANIPQPPNFELPNRVSDPLETGSKLEIIRVEAFVDNTSDSEYTRVWAEVGTP
ncbi:hypothetical protein NIES37_38080 [Tolypothrix tenuis PCC 7101]|uniref:Uncharacterized protein n=1 Tax=Tolypothrix tenuis PCC 7101 TaxID=231146 RepID=A0A1Z4N285_9CYAN|nr:hypothetical protein [Aulosira sp. FACHB-113]BAY99825.1 hypothetical protein NIES37_38080 [Tolypothrix tenuis PCC 7101]BAZ76253.1 hypothetical protein NIES50_48510 [Aulosira laxa NIES-50]